MSPIITVPLTGLLKRLCETRLERTGYHASVDPIGHRFDDWDYKNNPGPSKDRKRPSRKTTVLSH
jgi:hypothetical protein